MDKQIALIVLVVALLFLIFIGPPELGGIFLIIAVLIYAFGHYFEHGRGKIG